MWVPSLGQEDPLEEEMATHSRFLAWRIPLTEEPGGLQSTRLHRVGHDWSNLACMHQGLSQFSQTADGFFFHSENNCMGCRVLPYAEKAERESENEVAQSCLTLCNPMDCSLLGSSVHEIFQARILEWVAISFSRGSSQPRDQTRVFSRCRQTLYRLSHQGIPKCFPWEGY